MKYTDKQKKAIHTKERTVLVAAAAGSGKTSVLARRVALLIENGADIRKMLVVTFTSAAAAEMRTRIAQELYTMAVEKSDKRLQEQSDLAGVAAICTFHSFCGDVVRENYTEADIAPNFRIMNDEEATALRNNVLRDFFNTMYEEQHVGFLRLLARYTTRANDAQLMEIMLQVYAGMMGQPNPYDWALTSIHVPQEDYIDTLKKMYEQNLLSNLKDALRLLEMSADVAAEYNEEQLQADIDSLRVLRELVACVETDGISTAVNCYSDFKIPNLIRNIDPNIGIQSRDWRSKARSTVNNFLSDSIYPKFEQMAAKQLVHTQEDVQELVMLIKKFEALYAQQKKEMNVMDYNDMEHKALRVLRTRDEQYKSRFEYIFIDEYQDTNPVQDEIIHIMHGENNKLFMVGDVKQSIYRFRQADPGIFRKKVDDLMEGNISGEIIAMNDNFRSSGKIIDSVNYVMRHVMDKELGGVEYSGKEKLNKTADGGQASILISQVPPNAKELGLRHGHHSAEAMMIAQNIEKILDIGIVDSRTGERENLAYEDIAILVRSRSQLIGEIKQELDMRGIPCVIYTTETRDFPELDLFVNLLRLILNPMQDVPLLSVLRSYIGGFTEEDFAAIRIAHKENEPFHRAVQYYTNTHKDDLAKRLQKFYQQMQFWTDQSEVLSLMDLVQQLIEHYRFRVYLSSVRGGNTKKIVFDEFLQLVQTIAQSEDNSLYTLLQRLDDTKKRKGGYIDSTGVDSQANSVRIMTVHGSKGLEFPVVYLAGTNKRFSRKDINQSFLMHSDFGVTAKYVDENKGETFETIERLLMRQIIMEENKSEELRMLYVAMTRAKESLYITGYTSDYEGDMKKWEALKKRYNQADCLLDWVMGANACQQAVDVHCIEPKIMQDQGIDFDFDAWQDAQLEQTERKELLYLQERERIPAKVSVSSVRESMQPGVRSFFIPHSMEVEREEEKIAGAELGTLMHGIMEHVVRSDKNVHEQVEALCKRKLINEEEYEAVLENIEMVEYFLKSDLYGRMRKSSKVLYEQPFNMKKNANEIGYATNQTMLVQGIIDVAFIEDGRWNIVDYKTDRVQTEYLEQAAKNYSVQLELYAEALEQTTNIPVAAKYLYFMRPRRAVRV